MDYALQHFISDCAIRRPKNNSFTTHGKTYTISCSYGSFSVPFMRVTCDKSDLDKTINLNHQHYNRIVEAIIEDYKKPTKTEEEDLEDNWLRLCGE